MLQAALPTASSRYRFVASPTLTPSRSSLCETRLGPQSFAPANAKVRRDNGNGGRLNRISSTSVKPDSEFVPPVTEKTTIARGGLRDAGSKGIMFALRSCQIFLTARHCCHFYTTLAFHSHPLRRLDELCQLSALFLPRYHPCTHRPPHHIPIRHYPKLFNVPAG
jgi:hypothetical protein